MGAAHTLLVTAKDAARNLVSVGDSIDAERLEREQHAVHGLAWLATYVEALRQMHRWAVDLEANGRWSDVEALILQIAFGEYLARIMGGIPLGQGEIWRLQTLGLPPGADRRRFCRGAVADLVAEGNVRIGTRSARRI